MSPDELRESALRSAREGSGDCGLAAARELRDWDLCMSIINRWMVVLRFHGHYDLALAVLHEAPRTASDRYASTRLHRGFDDGTIDEVAPDPSLAVPPPVVDIATPGRASAHLAESLAAFATLRWVGRTREAADIVEGWHPYAETYRRGRAARGHDVTPFWYLQAGITHETVDQREAARQSYTDAWRMRDHDETGVVAFDAPAKLAAHATVRGHDRDARRWLDRMVGGASQEGGLPEFLSRSVATARLGLAVDGLELDEAAQHAGAWDDGSFRDELWPYGLWARCRHLLTLGEPLEALTEYDEAVARPVNVCGDVGLQRLVPPLVGADVLLALGWLSPARILIQGLPASDPRVAVVAARLHLIAGDAERARRIAEPLTAAVTDLPRARRELRLIAIAAAHALGDESGLAQQAVAAHAEARREGDLRVFLTVPGEVLDAAAAAVPELSDVVAQLAAIGLKPIYPARATLVELTERELVVLRALAHHARIGDVADHLVVSPNTVKSQLQSLYKKFGVSERDALLAEGIRGGYLSPARR